MSDNPADVKGDDGCICGWPGDDTISHESFCAAVNAVHNYGEYDEPLDDDLVDELLFEDGGGA